MGRFRFPAGILGAVNYVELMKQACLLIGRMVLLVCETANKQ